MTTEETELTFVRCPSCRSLVPAVATRCRMCGHTFDGVVEASEDEGRSSQQSKSRVRQRTMSVSRDEIGEVMQSDTPTEVDQQSDTQEPDANFSFQDRFSEDEAPVDEGLVDEGLAGDANGDFDPMAELFGENRGTDSDSSSTEDFKANDAGSADVGPESEDSNELFESSSEEEDSTLLGAPVFAETEDDAEIVKQDSATGKEADVSDLASREDSVTDESESVQAEGGERKKKRRRRRRKKKPSPEQDGDAETSDGSDAEVAAAVGSSIEESPVEQIAVDFVEESQESSTGAASVEEDSTQGLEKEEKVEETFFKEEQDMTTQDVVGEQTNSISPAQAASAPEVSGEDAGSLVGWLVTYGPNGKGDSIEVRSGRFFIGRQKLRENDMVIGDSALSTPHCLVSAEMGNGIQVQDLMSEQGTFIKKSGASEFVRTENVSLIQHGDTLRFGAYELLVCLIP